MFKVELTVGTTYHRGKQERTILEVTDKIVYYVTKTDKRTNDKYKRDFKHGCTTDDFILWIAKAEVQDSAQLPQKNMTVAQKRAAYLSRSRQYFKYKAEKLRENFTFDSWAYQGLNWGDWDNYIIRLVCHSLGVCTIDQLYESEIEPANKLAIQIIDLIFDANVAALIRVEKGDPHEKRNSCI